VFGSTPNDGAQPWMVPETLTTRARIRITHINDPELTDVSDADFEIAAVPGIQVTTPSGGELWEIGTRREIRWEGTLDGGAMIELTRDGGATWETLFTNTPNDGVADWEVVGPASTTCRVRVTRLEPVNGLTLVGESAANFGIVEDVTSFALTRPTGQEIFVVGTSSSSRGTRPKGGNVRLELSRDAGITWETIFGNTPNDGAQIWTVTGPVSPACLMKITSLDDETVVDQSDETFYITATPGSSSARRTGARCGPSAACRRSSGAGSRAAASRSSCRATAAPSTASGRRCSRTRRTTAPCSGW
jgi:hypothetical protein